MPARHRTGQLGVLDVGDDQHVLAGLEVEADLHGELGVRLERWDAAAVIAGQR